MTSSSETPTVIWIEDAPKHIGETVTLRGWVYQKRSSGKIRFLILRDGTGYIQGVAGMNDLSPEDWEKLDSLTQESSVRVTGEIRADKRSASGCELTLATVEPIAIAPEYPSSPRNTGPSFSWITAICGCGPDGNTPS